MYRFKMAAKNEFSFRENSHVTRIWKTTFLKEFFNEIWLKIGEHEYIYIAEIKFKKKIHLKMVAKTILSHPQTLIYAN